MAAPSTKTRTCVDTARDRTGQARLQGLYTLREAAFKGTTSRGADAFPRSCCCLLSHCLRRNLSVRLLQIPRGDETWELQSSHKNSRCFKPRQARGSCTCGMRGCGVDAVVQSRPGLEEQHPHPHSASVALGASRPCGKGNVCSVGPAQSGEPPWDLQCCCGDPGTPPAVTLSPGTGQENHPPAAVPPLRLQAFSPCALPPPEALREPVSHCVYQQVLEPELTAI